MVWMHEIARKAGLKFEKMTRYEYNYEFIRGENLMFCVQKTDLGMNVKKEKKEVEEVR
jgi:hypothetical protein